MKNRRKIYKFSLYEFNVFFWFSFSFVKIFFRIQISLQFVKQTIIWNAIVYFFLKFERLEIGIFKDVACHHFYNSNWNVHFPLQNIKNTPHQKKKTNPKTKNAYNKNKQNKTKKICEWITISLDNKYFFYISSVYSFLVMFSTTHYEVQLEWRNY